MRKLIDSTSISLDGVVEQPHLWPTIERPSDERVYVIRTDLLAACDAVLAGRRTRTTLEGPDWANTTAMSTSVAERIRELNDHPGRDIVRYGFERTRILAGEGGVTHMHCRVER